MLSKIKYYVDKSSLNKVYHALFKSKLQYAILSWGNANKTDLQPLRVLQNKAIRHLTGASRFHRMNDLYLNYRLFKIDNLYTFELGKFMYRFKKNTLPHSFSCYFKQISETRSRVTRSTSRGAFLEVRCNSKLGERSIKWQGSRLWNKLPEDLKKITVDSKFVKSFKCHIFSKF